MQVANLRGEQRQPGGKHANERLRRRGMIPAVIYGHGEAPEAVAVSLHDLEAALEHLAHVVRLDINGAGREYLLKDVQYDHLQRTPLHVDLMRVDAAERVHVKVAIELRGTAAGTHHGGVVVQQITDLDIECPLNAIPDTLRVNIGHLEVNQAVHVSDIALPEGARALVEPEAVVVAVRYKREATPVEPVAAAEGESTQPEVIGRVAKEEASDEK
jgi:large subunit ribosomal protein L25